MTTIVTEFGKIIYNRLPMGMCNSGEILQAKSDELIGDIEGVKACINDILVLSRDISEDHIGQLRIIFRRLCSAGLKIILSEVLD